MTREELVAIQEQLKSDQSAAIDADKKVLQLTEQLSSAKQASPKLTKELENARADYKSFKERVNIISIPLFKPRPHDRKNDALRY